MFMDEDDIQDYAFKTSDIDKHDMNLDFDDDFDKDNL